MHHGQNLGVAEPSAWRPASGLRFSSREEGDRRCQDPRTAIFTPEEAGARDAQGPVWLL